MIEFIRVNKNLSLTLLLSILFFLRKGIQYSLIGNVIPLLIIIGFIILLTTSVQKSRTAFILIARIWAIILIILSTIRLLISIIHLTIKPFDNSFHMTHQFSGYSIILSILMLILGILMLRGLSKKRIKDWL